jgi:hypothetical protein
MIKALCLTLKKWIPGTSACFSLFITRFVFKRVLQLWESPQHLRFKLVFHGLVFLDFLLYCFSYNCYQSITCAKIFTGKTLPDKTGEKNGF